MEQIPIEVIEMADDFFSRMNDEELKIMMGKYVREQPYLFQMYNAMLKATKDKAVIMRCTYAFLIIYRSFHYYDIKFPFILKKNVDVSTKKIITLIKKEMDPEASVIDVAARFVEILGQSELLSFIYHNILGTSDKPVNYPLQKNVTDAFLSVTILVFILQNETMKQIGNEGN